MDDLLNDSTDDNYTKVISKSVKVTSKIDDHQRKRRERVSTHRNAQKLARENRFQKNRTALDPVNNISLQNVPESKESKKLSRKERLEQWQKEKSRQKAKEKHQKKKPIFAVRHVNHSPSRYNTFPITNKVGESVAQGRKSLAVTSQLSKRLSISKKHNTELFSIGRSSKALNTKHTTEESSQIKPIEEVNVNNVEVPTTFADWCDASHPSTITTTATTTLVESDVIDGPIESAQQLSPVEDIETENDELYGKSLNSSHELLPCPAILNQSAGNITQRKGDGKSDHPSIQTTPMPSLVNRFLMKNNIQEETSTPYKGHAVKHFTGLIENNTNRLVDLQAKWNSYVENEPPTEQVAGQIRTVIGQAQLLLDQRFKQFADLIQYYKKKEEEKPTLSTDLEGFWAMIDIQVNDVYDKFEALELSKNKNWEEAEEKKKKPKRKAAPQKESKLCRKTSDNKRSKALEDFKKEMRKKKKQEVSAKIEEGTETAEVETEKEFNQQGYQEKIQSTAYVTVLTPVRTPGKRKYKSIGEYTLTPVRRSTRKRSSLLPSVTPTQVTVIPQSVSSPLMLGPTNQLLEGPGSPVTVTPFANRSSSHKIEEVPQPTLPRAQKVSNESSNFDLYLQPTTTDHFQPGRSTKCKSRKSVTFGPVIDLQATPASRGSPLLLSNGLTPIITRRQSTATNQELISFSP